MLLDITVTNLYEFNNIYKKKEKNWRDSIISNTIFTNVSQDQQ